jgi:nitrate/nitrite transporter NarK
VIVCGLALFLVNPPESHSAGLSASASPDFLTTEYSPLGILRTGKFWLLWVLYFIGAGSGLMVISSISGMAKKTMGESAFIAVAVMAIGNAAGRVIAGTISDHIGRRLTLMLVLLIQAICMFIAIPVTASADGAKFAIVMVATMIGFNYGANLCIFPSITKDLWGLKGFGMNYGCLFTAWGIGGFALSRLQQMLKASSGTFSSSFMVAGMLLFIGAALTAFLKIPKQDRN